MYVFEPTTACCEAGVEDVVMTTVANDLKLLLLSYCNTDTISYQGVLLSAAILEPSHVVTLTLPYRMAGQHCNKPVSVAITR